MAQESQNAANVPATMLSSFQNQYPATMLKIGNNYYAYPGNYTQPGYWYVAVDLTSLKVVQTIATTNTVDVPAPIQALLGNPQYFLFFCSNMQSTMNMITGPQYTFLRQVGSNGQLDRGEQIIEQLGTGTLLNFSYILAATFDTNDIPGFEVFSTFNYTILAMQFMPITVNGQTIYAPVNPF
jgi:hypothetical protein